MSIVGVGKEMEKDPTTIFKCSPGDSSSCHIQSLRRGLEKNLSVSD